MTEKATILKGTILLVLASLVVTSPVACAVHRDRQIAQAIHEGQDPIAVRCAFSGVDGYDRTTCALKALERK